MTNCGTIDTNENLLSKRPSSMKVEKVVHIDLKTKALLFKYNGQRRPVTCIEANMCNAVRNDKLVAIRNKSSNIYSIIQNA